MKDAKKKTEGSWVIMTLNGGFYYFGREIDSEEGYLTLVEAAMFGGYSGGAGMPGVSRGAKDAKVNLDRFEPTAKISHPISAVISVAESINLYEFKGTTQR